MAGPERKYVLDTNLFIHAFREPRANAELQRFHQAFAPFEYLSVIVAQELRAGIRARGDRQRLERSVLDVYRRRGRLIAPSPQVGRIRVTCCQIGPARRARSCQGSKAFGNDILLALSCRESGLVLLTDNRRISNESLG